LIELAVVSLADAFGKREFSKTVGKETEVIGIVESAILVTLAIAEAAASDVAATVSLVEFIASFELIVEEFEWVSSFFVVVIFRVLLSVLCPCIFVLALAVDAHFSNNSDASNVFKEAFAVSVDIIDTKAGLLYQLYCE
jgi:hypothetical protein